MNSPCPNCHSGAVVSSAMPGAPDLQVQHCSACGLRWSALDCDSRGCRDRAVQKCRECGKFKCKGHAGGRSGVCPACVKRIAVIVQPRRGSWERTRNNQ